MESDQQNPENFDQVITSDDQGASQARSYDCNFCKRGFSNAQALGGHMNIHRNEKAKLKQFSNETQSSLDIPRVASSYSPIPTNCSWPSEAKPGTDHERSKIKWPWILSKQGDETHVGGEVQQLPLLFVETPTNVDQKPRSQLLSYGNGSSGSELNLELTLGPEPHQDSPAETVTKKFF